MPNSETHTLLDEIIGDMIVFENPDLLQEEYSKKIDNSSINLKKLRKYHIELSGISQTCKKIKRYAIIFERLYPENEAYIRNTEALEHHIHAYLEDLHSLKEKMTAYIETLKNDLKKKAPNAKEVIDSVKIITEKIYETFENVAQHRNPHHHQGMRFADGDIIDSDIAHALLKEDHPLHASFRPEYLEKLKAQEKESFEKAKTAWIRRAEDNGGQIDGFITVFFETHGDALYNLLGMKSAKKLFQEQD